MVSLSKKRDKFGQQRQGRSDGAIRSTADRRPMGENPSLASEAAAPPAGRQTTGQRPQSTRRNSVDFAQWRSLAGFARRVSLTGDLLAAASRLGRAGNLAHHLARISGGTEPTRTTRLERIVSGRQFCSGQKRGSKVGKTKRGKGTKWMVVVDGQGVPLGKQLYSASPNEVRLAEETLAAVCVSRRHHSGRPRQKVRRVIADRAFDSDPLRAQLAARGIELIAPHRWNRSKPRTQDGRALRRYRRRWKVERTFAWLGNFRRLVVRYDRSITIYEAFFHIACFMITLRRVLK
ncbi:MAG: IS5 family transposase [Candidatus Acidiferrales bacterium]